ncbi:MAG: aspartyl protease family protein [Rhodomicrobium sp.]
MPRLFWPALLLLAAVAGEALAEPCLIVKQATIPLGRRSSYLTAPARIEGAGVTMGLDTGAQTFVTPEIAARLHLDRDLRRTRVHGTTKDFTVNNFVVQDLKFGDAHFRYKSVPAIKLLNVTAFGQQPVAGLLGADVFSGYDLDFDFAGSALTLYRVQGCRTVAPPWTGDYTATPIRITGQRRISLAAELDGTRLTGLFDTGATESAVSRSAALRAGVTEASLNSGSFASYVGAGNFAAKTPVHRFEKLTAAGLSMAKARFGVFAASRTETDMLLGRDFMASNRFWISYATRTMFVQRPKAPALAGIPSVWQDSRLVDRMLERPGEPPSPPLSNISPDSLRSLASPAPATRTAAVNPAPVSRPTQLVDPCSPASGMKRPALCDAGDQRPWHPAPASEEGYLGIAVRNLTPASVQTLGLSTPSAVLVARVRPGSPASEAGIKPGDVIVALDEAGGLEFNGFAQAIAERKPASPVRLDIVRAGERLKLSVALAGPEVAAKLKADGPSPERALAAEEAIATTFPREKFPLEWALARKFAGHQAARLTTGSSADNLEKTIEAYEEALSVPELYSMRTGVWAEAQEGLGDAYDRRQLGDRSQNIERAIKAFEAALGVRSQVAVRVWVRDKARLAAAYCVRIEGERADNIEEAIQGYEGALAVLKVAADPDDWGTIQAGLGAAYTQRIKGEKADNLERAIQAYEAALPHLGAKSFNSLRAELQRNLGAAYEQRIQGDRDGNLNRAAEAYSAALTVLTKEAFPGDHDEVERLKDRALAGISVSPEAGQGQ